MRFAIISDVHGNLPALNKVLEDARKSGADGYIFVGDYCLNNPYPNECIEKIRKIENKYVIRGNEEIYLENLVGKDQDTWTDGQFQISYWVYNSLSQENLDYLLSLPLEEKFRCNRRLLFVAHSSGCFMDDCEHSEFRTSKIAQRYRDKYITHEALSVDIKNYFDYNDKFQSMLKSMEDGIYIFGHTHIQWSYRSDDDKKILINPGSCGLPLDCIENGVPYTILDLSEEGNISIEEKRISFDKMKYIKSLWTSDQFKKAHVWTRIIAKEIQTSREQITYFFEQVEKYAREIGDLERPYSVSTWERAFELCEDRYKID